jgi:hypothetical protein
MNFAASMPAASYPNPDRRLCRNWRFLSMVCETDRERKPEAEVKWSGQCGSI